MEGILAVSFRSIRCLGQMRFSTPRCIEWWQLLLVAEFICLMNRYNENRHLVQNMSIVILDQMNMAELRLVASKQQVIIWAGSSDDHHQSNAYVLN